MDTFTGSSVKALEMVQLSHIVLNFRLFARFNFTRIYMCLKQCRGVDRGGAGALADQ